MDDAIFGASASIPAVKLDGNILRDVSNKPLNVTMSGEGAFPKKLLASGQNIVKMPTSGSGIVGGLNYEFTPNGLNVHGTATGSIGAVVELAPLLTDNGICLPDGFKLRINKKLPDSCSIAIWDDGYVVSHSGPTQGVNIGATGGLVHVALWVASAVDVDIDGIQVAIVYGENGSYEYANGTGEVCDTGVDGAFTGDDSVTVTVPAFDNDGDTIILLTDSETQPTFSTEATGDPQVSLNIGGRRNGEGITLSETAKSLRNNQFQISSTNAHPNAAANRWRYTALQEFLRRL